MFSFFESLWAFSTNECLGEKNENMQTDFLYNYIKTLAADDNSIEKYDLLWFMNILLLPFNNTNDEITGN